MVIIVVFLWNLGMQKIFLRHWVMFTLFRIAIPKVPGALFGGYIST